MDVALPVQNSLFVEPILPPMDVNDVAGMGKLVAF